MFNIGVVGAQGTGKSTLSKALSERMGVPLITEQARIVAQEMGISDLTEFRNNAPLEEKVEFQKRVLDRQIEVENSLLHGFVSDRTTIDNAAYWLCWNHALVSHEERLEYLKKAHDHALKSYDFLIYTPIEFEIVDDGFRETNKDYQAEVDFLVVTLLKGWGLTNRVLRASGSVEERVKHVLSIISNRSGISFDT